MIHERGQGGVLIAISTYLIYHDPPWMIFANSATSTDLYNAILKFLVELCIFIGGLGLFFIEYKQDTALVMQAIGLYGTLGLFVVSSIIEISRAIYSLIISYL